MDKNNRLYRIVRFETLIYKSSRLISIGSFRTPINAFIIKLLNPQSTFMLEFVNSIVEKDESQIFSTWLIIQMERIQCIFDNEGLDRSEQCSKLNALYKNHFTEQNSSIPAVEKVIKN